MPGNWGFSPLWVSMSYPTITTWPFQFKAAFEVQLTVIFIWTWQSTSPPSSTYQKHCCLSLQWLKCLRAVQTQDRELFWYVSFFFLLLQKGGYAWALFLKNFTSCCCSASSRPILWATPCQIDMNLCMDIQISPRITNILNHSCDPLTFHLAHH